MDNQQVTGIGQFATLCLEKGKTAQETLDMVKQVFPNCTTTLKGIYFYASKAKIRLGRQAEVDKAAANRALVALGVKEKRVRKPKAVKQVQVAA